ncbi:MAG: dihydropteroate synthase [Bacillota bacterium]|nr:dihydropteroate synthase [Bacillota bacterium]MDP4160827.1 dihydropteroate synthase [Bacillota bacterium]
METKISSATKDVIISEKQTTLIGERINPTGKKKLAEALRLGDYEQLILQEARNQILAGADILDVNVGTGGVDEVVVLPKVVQLLMAETDTPLCFDSGDGKALEACLKVYKGRALINSVKGTEHSMDQILPLVKEYGAAVIVLPADERGIPRDVETRMEIFDRVIERAGKLGIPLNDIVVDALVLSVGVDGKGGLVTFEVIRQVKEKYGVNITLGASNISYGVPGRDVVNGVFLGMAIAAGCTCPVVDVAKVRKHIMAADLLLGNDRFSRRYLKYFRENESLF